MKKKRSFELLMFTRCIIPNSSAAIVLICYIFLFSGLSGKDIISIALSGLSLLIMMQLFIAPFTNKLVAHKISLRIEDWEKGNTTKEERTQLLKDILRSPVINCATTFIVFLVATILWGLWFKYILGFSNVGVFFVIMSCLLAGYMGAVIGMYEIEKFCSEYAIAIIREGVDEEVVMEEGSFGTSMKTLYVLSIFVPVIFSAIITFFFFWENIGNISTQILIIRAGGLLTMNSIFTLVLTTFCGIRIMDYMRKMHRALLAMDKENIINADLVPTDLANEISHNMYLINKTIMLFREVLEKTKLLSDEIFASAQDLVVISTETSTTAVEQSTGIKEIVSTMEDADQLSRNIADKVKDVTVIASKTADEVQNGFEALRSSVNKMHQISEANTDTITGIKQLNGRIESVWEIVSIINEIADQTKIIAFNAELEASSAGEAGKNFHIVANEIRRLADRTMESTKEIRNRITEIQQSSDKLIITSEEGTEKIQEGCDLSASVEQTFLTIKTSAESTSDSATDIKTIVNQQTSGFEQILVTLKQVSAGIESFSSSTQTVSSAASKLQNITERLNKINSTEKENDIKE